MYLRRDDCAVRFYRNVLGLRLKFESPEWSEFVTGEMTLALFRNGLLGGPSRPGSFLSVTLGSYEGQLANTALLLERL